MLKKNILILLNNNVYMSNDAQINYCYVIKRVGNSILFYVNVK